MNERTSEPDPVVVRIDGLVKRFPQRVTLTEKLRHPFRQEWFEALRGVSLEIRSRELFGLLGPNGAGKTTLLKVLSTLVLSDEGTVEVAGHDVRREPGAVRAALTPVIADERSLNWRLSAYDNLAVYAALYDVPPDQRDERIRSLIERVGLVEAGIRMVGAYSSGMKQRLLVARALLSRPQVLILDEPTRSLDPVSARNLRDFIRTDLIEREGCTVILATHNSEEAFGLCDRLAVLDQGRVIAKGTAAELARQAGADRCRLVVPTEAEERARRLITEEVGPTDVSKLRGSASADPEWVALEVDLPGGFERSARLVRELTDEGIVVAEFSRVPLPLAELIERLVARAAA